MSTKPLPHESESEPTAAPPVTQRPGSPVSDQKTIRETSHRVMPSRDSGRPPERHDQQRQPKRGRHKEPGA